MARGYAEPSADSTMPISPSLILFQTLGYQNNRVEAISPRNDLDLRPLLAAVS